MCGSEAERKKRQQEFNSTTLILLVCLCCLPPTVWQKQTMCGSGERKDNINKNDIIVAYVTYFLQFGRDRRCVVVSGEEEKTTGI